ncbi:MAG: hypothetical protein WKG06_32880 [Segetibacter sp.]
MKSLIKIFLLLFFIVTGMWSCTKDEKKDYFEGGTAPVLTSSVSGNIPLSSLDKKRRQ